MKTTLLNLILIVFTTCACFSQEQLNWNDIKKVELYSFSTAEYCNNIKSENLDNQNAILCDKNDFIDYLMELKAPEFDVLFESNCLILRINFSKSKIDFILLLEQGILIDLNNYGTMLQIKKNSDFNKLIENYLN